MLFCFDYLIMYVLHVLIFNCYVFKIFSFNYKQRQENIIVVVLMCGLRISILLQDLLLLFFCKI